MAIARVASASFKTANTQTNTSLSVTLQSTTVGDLNVIDVIGQVASATNNTFTTPTGWTKIDEAFDSGSNSVTAVSFARIFQSGDSSSVSITWANAGQACAVCTAYSGADSTTPIGDANFEPKGTTTTSYNVALTTTATGWVRSFFGNKSGQTFSAYSMTNLGVDTFNTSASSIGVQDSNGDQTAATYTLTATGSGSTSIGAECAYLILPSAAPTSVTLPAETGTGADAITVSAALTLEDGAGLYGTGGYGGGPYSAAVDDITVAIIVPQTLPADTGTGSDAVAANAAIPLADPRTGVDAIALAATVTLTADTGTGADATTVAAAVPLADPRTATDALGAPSATVPLPADSGTATDALSVSGSASPNLPDTGTATDAIHATVTAATADTGTGTDTATTAAAVPLADSGAGADALTVSGSSSPNLPDTATATDALTVTVALTIADTRPSATDTLTTAAAVGFADTAAAADLLVAQITAYLADTAAAVDSVTAVAGSGIETGRAEGAAAASAGAGGGTAATTVLEASQPAAWPARGSDGATPAATSGNPSTPRAGG